MIWEILATFPHFSLFITQYIYIYVCVCEREKERWVQVTSDVTFIKLHIFYTVDS